MRTIGADIQIINLSRNKASEVLRKFTRSRGLFINQDIDDGKRVKIKVYNNINSYVKFWWSGIPQVVDWQLIQLNGQETKIETRFGFQKKFYFWFWSVVFSMVTVSSFLYHIGASQQVSYKPDELLGAINTALVAFLLLGLSIIFIFFFMVKSIQVTYDEFIDLITAEFKQYNSGFLQKRVRSNPAPPHMYDVLIFTLAVTIIIACKLGVQLLDKMSVTKLTLVFGVVGILIILLIVAIYCIKIKYFPQRLMFAASGIFFTIQLLIFYSVPYFNAYSGDFDDLYIETTRLEKKLKRDSNNFDLREKTSLFKHAVKARFIFAISSNVFIIALALITFSLTPYLINAIRRWRREFFSGKEWTIYREPVVDFSLYANTFSFIILTFWLLCSMALYMLIYTALGIAEYCLISKNIVFTTEIGKKFCVDTSAIFSFIFFELTGKSIAELISKIAIIIYLLPLFWIISKVIKKRIKNYNKCIREIKKYKINKEESTTTLHRICEEISEDMAISSPNLVLIPSLFPFLSAKFVGFPYFKSYILISKGCLNFRDNELSGLIAHEMYHVKQHTLKWYVLNVLSDITLFGTGFLAVTTNSYNQELRADHYAALWAKKKNAIPDFINALHIMSWSALKGANNHLNATPAKINILDENDKPKSVFKRVKRKIDMIFELYFGDEILSYIHPPIEQRIEKIKALQNIISNSNIKNDGFSS